MAMRSRFVGEDKSIMCYEVEWSPKDLSWADFRGKLLGPTNPSDAPKGSIRREMYKRLVDNFCLFFILFFFFNSLK